MKQKLQKKPFAFLPPRNPWSDTKTFLLKKN